MNKTIEKQIKEILKYELKDGRKVWLKQSGGNRGVFLFQKNRVIKELTNLLKQQREEAVRGFVEWLLEHNRFLGYKSNYSIQYNNREQFREYALETLKDWNGYIGELNNTSYPVNRNNDLSQQREKGKE